VSQFWNVINFFSEFVLPPCGKSFELIVGIPIYPYAGAHCLHLWKSNMINPNLKVSATDRMDCDGLWQKHRNKG
jgi:hypothetical protein